MPAGPQHIFTLRSVQTIRKIVLLLAVMVGFVALTVTASRWAEMSAVRYAIEWIGVVLIVVCIVGRTWSSFYIGGRKNREIVRIGPYSVSRNPLYLFSFIGAAGVGAQFGSLTIALFCVLIAWLVFRLVVNKEERALTARLWRHLPGLCGGGAALPAAAVAVEECRHADDQPALGDDDLSGRLHIPAGDPAG